MGLRLHAVFCVMIIHAAVFAEKTVTVKDIRYLNFDKKDNAQYVHWDNRADLSRIEQWASNRHLTVLKDIYTIRDGTAAYVSPFGSDVKLSGMNPNASYSLFIDFTVFRGGNDGILSKCVISADGRKLASVNFGEVPPYQPYEVVIPRDLYYDGDVVIRFEEFATTQGVWGIWDMVLSTEGLPAGTLTPVAEKPVIKDKIPAVAEPGRKKSQTEKKAVSTKEKQVKPAPVKTQVKEPSIIEPGVVKEPEIREPEAKEPKTADEPGLPSVPLQKRTPDIRDSLE